MIKYQISVFTKQEKFGITTMYLVLVKNMLRKDNLTI